MKEEKILLYTQRDFLLRALTHSIGFVERNKFRGVSDVLNSIGHNVPVLCNTIEKHPYITFGICVYYLSQKAMRKILNSVGVKLCALLDGTSYSYMKKNGMVRNFSEFLIYKKSLREKSSSDDEDILRLIYPPILYYKKAPQVRSFFIIYKQQ
ncbi:MAG: hypothetical protein EKK57_12465 [Proteobacteria bacterium]|nr:MAG: hypothetical protein EKK57_12465 [Pseudomonadota bacterium]